MAESGLLTEVRWEWDGPELSADVLAGTTVLPVDEASRLSAAATVWVGDSGPYAVVEVDIDAETVTIGAGLAEDTEEGETVAVDVGGQPGQVWVAEVVLTDSETPVEIPLTIHDLAVMPEGIYDPPRAVLISDDYQEIVDLPGQNPMVSGGFIDPSTLPQTPTSDGEVPAASPPTSLTPMYSTFVARWPQQANQDLVGYDVYLSAADVPATYIGTTYATSFSVSAEPGGGALRKGVAYSVWVHAFDEDGYATAAGNPGTATLTAVAPGDIEQAILDDIVQAQNDASQALTDAGTAQQAADDLAAEVAPLVEDYTVEYAVNQSETVAPTSGWSTAQPTRNPGDYIWYRTTLTRQNGTSSTSSPALLTGNDGAPGDAGVGISGTTVEYQVSASGTDTPTGTWSSTVPATSPGEFLWTRTTTDYTNASQTLSYSVAGHGEAGAAGNGITGTEIRYQVGTSATSAPGGTWVVNPPATAPGEYLWTRTVTTYDSSPDTTAYSVAAHGATGGPGDDGIGITGTQVRYQVGSSATSAPGGTWEVNPQATAPGQYLWTRTVTSYTQGADTTAYAVAAHGNTGQPGNGITGTEVRYQASSSGTTIPTGFTATSPPATTAGQYLWTRTVTSYNTGSPTTAYSVARHGVTGSQGVSITAVTPYYAQVADGAAAPATPGNVQNPPDPPWKAVQPAFAANTDLYITERISYSNSTWSYTPASKSAPYEAALQAWVDAQQALSDAFDANEAAGNAQSTANGKNAIWYLPSEPPGTGHAVDDVWFDTDDGYTPHTWDGSIWAPRQWGHQSIATLDVGKATVGFLSAARLKAHTIGVRHLEISDQSNLWADPYFNLQTDPNTEALVTRISNTTVGTGAAPPAGGNVAVLNNRDHVGIDTFAAKPGDEFLIEATYKYVSGSAPFNLGLWQLKVDGTATTSVQPYDNGERGTTNLDAEGDPLPDTDLGGGWFRKTWKVTANPAATDMARASVWLQIDQAAGGSGGTVVHVTDLWVRRRGKGTLLVDGAVSARQVGADVMVTNEFFSREAYLGYVKADRIESGELEAALAVIGGLYVGTAITINPKEGIVITTPLGKTVLPADGENPQFTGTATFNELTVLGNLAILGLTNEISKGSSVSLANAVTAPKSGPTMQAYWPEKTIHEGFSPRGFTRHSSTGRYASVESVGVAVVSFYTENAGSFALITGGQVNVSSPSDGGLGAWNRPEVVNGLGGVTIIGNTMYVLCQTDESTPGNVYQGRWYVYRGSWNSGTGKWDYVGRWLYEPEQYLGGHSFKRPALGQRESNGNLLITQAGAGSGRLHVTEWSPGSGTYIQRWGVSYSNGVNYEPDQHMAMVIGTSADVATERFYVLATNDGLVRAVNPAASGFISDDHNFVVAEPGQIVGGMWDASKLIFRVRTATTAYDHTAMRMNTLTGAMTWRKSDGVSPDFAQYETDKSGITNLTNWTKRAGLRMSIPGTIPVDGTDPNSPDAVTFYLAENNTSGANATLRRQTVPAPGVTEVEYPSVGVSGGNPPAASTFPATSTPARIYSIDDGTHYIDLKGNGVTRLNGLTGAAGSTTFNQGTIKKEVDRREWMQSGTGTVTISGTNVTYTQVIPFPVDFPTGTTVDVVVSLLGFGHNTSNARVGSTGHTTSQFTAQAQRTAGTGNIDFTWIAVARP